MLTLQRPGKEGVGADDGIDLSVTLPSLTVFRVSQLHATQPFQVMCFGRCGAACFWPCCSWGLGHCHPPQSVLTAALATPNCTHLDMRVVYL